MAVTSCSNGVCGWVANKCSVFSGHPDNTHWVPCDSHVGGEGEAAVSRHRGQRGSEESDHAGGRHVRVHCSRSANIHQRNHFPGGEGKSVDCMEGRKELRLSLALRLQHLVTGAGAAGCGQTFEVWSWLHVHVNVQS